MQKQRHKQSERFEIRCSASELLAWKKAAKKCELSLAQFIRLCIREKCNSLNNGEKSFIESGITKIKLPTGVTSTNHVKTHSQWRKE